MADELRIDTVRPLLPPRAAEAHKGRFGHLLIVAGSLGMLGAAKLAARAAGRSGAGLVTLALPGALAAPAAASLTETMLLPLPEDPGGAFSPDALDAALAAAAARDAAVIGPGLSARAGAPDFARAFIRRCPAPLLIDADALNALAGDAGTLSGRPAPTILTPHPGEMARLTGESAVPEAQAREGLARSAAAAWGCVVVLKGHGTVVAAPDGRAAVNTTGGHGLAKGGTGDVLAGLIGGLLAQGMDSYDAACLGVFTHGLAGDLAAEALGPRGMAAGDVVDRLPGAWRRVEGTA